MTVSAVMLSGEDRFPIPALDPLDYPEIDLSEFPWTLLNEDSVSPLSSGIDSLPTTSDMASAAREQCSEAGSVIAGSDTNETFDAVEPAGHGQVRPGN